MAKLAIKGGKPVRTKPFLKWPMYEAKERNGILEVLSSRRWGHQTKPYRCCELQEKFAQYIGTEFAIAVTNGSVALEVPLRTVGIGPGDEVITPPTTWVATNLAPVLAGAEAVFADICPDTYCLDPERVKEMITPKTRAIIPVHFGGYLADMDKIMAIAKKHNLIVIEDCAQAHGSQYKGKRVGSIGDFGAFSFEISKLMTAGEGGIITTNDKYWAEKAYAFTHAGRIYGETGHYQGKIMCWNHRMTEFQAAILLVQLTRLEKHKRMRIKNAEYLKKRLSEIDGIKSLRQDPGQNYYFYIFKYNKEFFRGISVHRFREALNAEGIPCFCSAHQKPVYRANGFGIQKRDYSKVFCPVAERAHEEEAVGLQATWTLLGEKKDMDDIIKAVYKIKENALELEKI